MSIGVGRILRESSKFTSVTVLSKLLSLPVMVVLGRKLSPEAFGTVASVTLVLLYAGLVSPGFTNASAREIAHHTDEGESPLVDKIESVANGSDFLFSLGIFGLILGAAFLQKTPIHIIGFIIISFIYISERIKTYYFNANYYRQNFNVNVLANTAGSLANPLTAVLFVGLIGAYALLVAPLAASLATTVYYFCCSKRRIHFAWDSEEAKRLFKEGIVLSLGGIVFWAFRLSDRTAVTLFMSESDLGHYFYAMSFVLMALGILADFGRVLESMLWSETGRSKSAMELRGDIKKLSLFIACVGGATIPALQLGYFLTVSTMVPKFGNTTSLFNVMSLGIYPVLLVMVPNVMLKSKMMSKERSILTIYSLATAFSFVVDVVAIKLGYGLIAIAWLSLLSLFLVCFWLILLIRDSVASSTKGFVIFSGKLLLPFAASLIACFALALLRKTTGTGAIMALCFLGIELIACAPFVVFFQLQQASPRGLGFSDFYARQFSLSLRKSVD